MHSFILLQLLAVLLAVDGAAVPFLVKRLRAVVTIAPLALLGPAVPGTSWEVHAASRTNPEAIDVKRVNQEPVLAPQSPAFQSKTVTLENGVQYFDAIVGDGPAAEQGRSVQFQWVIRRANGYFVDASSNYGDEPFIYRVGDQKKIVPGIDSAIRGMKVGGVRRMLLPATQAFVGGLELDSPGPVPRDFGPRRQLINIQSTNQNVYFEIKLTKVK